MSHTVVITQPPVLSGKQSTPDGGICGNGDLAAVLGSSGSGIRVYLGKTDLWCASPEQGESGIRPLGYVDIDIPSALYNKVYHVEQKIEQASLSCEFRDGYSCVEAELVVPATANMLLISLKWSRNFSCPAVQLSLSETPGGKVTPFEQNDIKGAVTDFAGKGYLFETHAATAIRKVYEQENAAVFAVYSVTANDAPDYRTECVNTLSSLDQAVIAKLTAEHKEYWETFFSASGVSLSDKQLELDWYTSLYLLAVCKGKPMFPPGLYGNFITVNHPAWAGDYHLNYNYEAPFYGAVSSNHPELTDHYADPLFAALERGKENAESYLGCDGIYYPVAIGPGGLFTEEDLLNPDRMFLGQKFCASYAAVVMIMRWKGTGEKEYAVNCLYPYLRELGKFWDSFLKNEKGRYVIYGDAIHEIPYYEKGFKASKYRKEIRAKNSVLSLGIVRMVYSALVELADVVPEAAPEKERWQSVLDNLSRYPVKRGKYVYTQKGIKKRKTNTVGIQHIYPMGQGGSDRKSMKISRKTVEKTHRWKDENGTSSLYPAAVRVGMPAGEILKHYRGNKEQFGLPNGLYNHSGGCLENVSIAPAMLNEMMLRSCDGVVCVFPDWDPSLDCEFRNLRADGAFLVSSKMASGIIEYVSVVSEKGNRLVIANPFTAKAYGGCVCTIDGESSVQNGKFLEIDLPAGGSVQLTPSVLPQAKMSKKEKKAVKKAAKKTSKKAVKKTAKKAAKAEKKAVKDDKFFTAYERKQEKKQAKVSAKKEKKENKKYAKFDKKTAKYQAKRKK